jgi:hypothetical protein
LQLPHSTRTSQQAPKLRGRTSRNSLSFSPTIEPSSINPSQRSSGNSDSVFARSVPSSNASIDLRQASSCESLISPKYRTWRCTTRPPLTRRFSTMLKVRWSLPSFRRILVRRNMTAADYAHNPRRPNSLGRHYSRFRNLSPATSTTCVPKKSKSTIESVKSG